MLSELLLKKFVSAFSVPIQAYSKVSLLFSYPKELFKPSLAHYFLQPYINKDYKVCFMISPDYLMYGYISIPENDEYLIIGPCCPYELSAKNAKNIIKDMNLSAERLDEMLRWFHYIPQMDVPAFRNMLDFLHTMLCPDNNESPVHVTYKNMPSNIKFDHPADTPAELNIAQNLEQEILRLVEHGKPKELKASFDSLSSQSNLHMGTLGPTAIRSIKNTCICIIAITSRTALKGGVDYSTIISLTDYHIAKMEKLSFFPDIMNLLITTTIDFACRVECCQSIKSNSPIVTSVLRYVGKNIKSKVTSRDIAKNLFLEPTYLCHIFKNETGKTITTYVHERKIREAQYLLDSTALSLAEVSEQLGYSSQQQFQTSFKNITGLTPGEYRKQRRL